MTCTVLGSRPWKVFSEILAVVGMFSEVLTLRSVVCVLWFPPPPPP